MKNFGHTRPVRDENGDITGMKPSPAKAITVNPLGGMFGADKRRRLVFALAEGDIVTMKPHGTRRAVSIPAVEVYRFALQCVANKARMEKLRNRKAVKAAARERRNLAAAERRMRQQLKTENQ